MPTWNSTPQQTHSPAPPAQLRPSSQPLFLSIDSLYPPVVVFQCSPSAEPVRILRLFIALTLTQFLYILVKSALISCLKGLESDCPGPHWWIWVVVPGLKEKSESRMMGEEECMDMGTSQLLFDDLSLSPDYGIDISDIASLFSDQGENRLDLI